MMLHAAAVRLVDQGNGSLLVVNEKSEAIFQVDGSGSTILRLIMERRQVTSDYVVTAMVQMYAGAPADCVIDDTKTFIDELESSGLVLRIQDAP